MEYRVISTDSHCSPKAQSWKERMPAGLRERVPAPREAATKLAGLGQMAGRNFKEFTQKTVAESEMRPGNWDPVEFLKDQDVDGVDACVLYAQGQFPGPDAEVRIGSHRAHNDWLIEDFVSANDKRLIGLAPIPIEDGVEEAVEEFRRSVRNGHRGAVLPSHPAVSYADPSYEPLWAAAEELGFPLHMHRASGSNIPDGLKADKDGGPGIASIVMRFTAPKEAVCYMLFSGVFTRHPHLKMVTAESDFGWLPFFIQCCDDMYERQRYWANLDLGRLPSEIIRDQVYCTFMDDAVGTSNLAFTGEDNVMWSSDYPHSVSTWPESNKYIEKQVAGLSPETRHKLLAGNAARLYRLN